MLGIERLQEAYFARFPDYPRGITVPAIVEESSGKVVTNDFPRITHDLYFEWQDYHRPDAPNLWPDDLRDEMDEVMERVFTEVNNGVYRCGFAGSQEAYEDAYDRLLTALDWLEERLADRRYLMGDAITEADVRLYTTLARFDAVYHGHFKCNRNKLTEMPALWGYARDLFQTPGFGDTDRLRPDQGALLPRAHRHQPVRDRPEGPGPGGLADAARSRLSAASADGRGRERTRLTGRTGRCRGLRCLSTSGFPGRPGKPTDPYRTRRATHPLVTMTSWATTTITPRAARRTARGSASSSPSPPW